MLILVQIPESNLSFPSLEKLHEGGLVSPWRPELISVGCSGMKWRGRVMVFWGEGLEPALALAKREGDWGNVLNTCNRWNLVNVWECLGGWEGDEEEECIVSREPELHRREEGVQEKKKLDWYHKFLPITFHFQVMKAVEQKSWSTVSPARWDKFLEEISTKCTPEDMSWWNSPREANACMHLAAVVRWIMAWTTVCWAVLN